MTEHTMPQRTRLIVGCMSGTSMDGIDAALVEVRGTGLEMSARFVRGASGSLGDGAGVLRRLAHGEACTAREITKAARDLAVAHVVVIRDALDRDLAPNEEVEDAGTGGTPVPLDRVEAGSLAFVCVHGQTVFHAPPLSWQVMNAAVIAREIGVPVVHDLRAMDLGGTGEAGSGKDGGQGAPITPIADWVMFRERGDAKGSPSAVTCVVNLGGFANATIWREGAGVDAIRGFDICACNQVLDALARERLGEAYDADGTHAVRGRVDADGFGRVRTVMERQWREGRSLGTGDEARGVVLQETGRLNADDACATTVAAIGSVIAMAMDEAAGGVRGARRVMLAGGGARNAALRDAIAVHSCVRDARTRVATTAERGVSIEMREAVCFAVLGALCQDGVAITLPAVTHGAAGVISGSWTGLRSGWRASE